MKKTALILFALCACSAQGMLISTDRDTNIGTLYFTDGDIVNYSPSSSQANIFLGETTLEKNVNVNAFEYTGGSKVYFSLTSAANILGLKILNGDIVELDISSGQAQIVFDHSAFGNNNNVNGVSVLANGNIAFTATNSDSIAGTAFSSGDIVEYDINNGSASILFSESNFSSPTDITAFTILDDGRFLFTTNSANTIAGLSFTEHDLVVYNQQTNSAQKYLSDSFLADGTTIDAIASDSIPEPATIFILLAGLAAAKKKYF